jgi:hypothetical protein
MIKFLQKNSSSLSKKRHYFRQIFRRNYFENRNTDPRMSWPKCLRPSVRRILALMVFWGQIQNYMMRVNLSILIVAMVRDSSKNFFLNFM